MSDPKLPKKYNINGLKNSLSIKYLKILKLMISIMIVASTLLIGNSASLAENDSYLCYGPGYLYSTDPPQGWVLDNISGKGDGLCLVAYPKDGSWAHSETVMYINTAQKVTKKHTRSVDEIIKADVQRQKARGTKLTVVDGKSLSNKGKVVHTRYFLNKGGPYEAVAYIDEPNVVIFIVMTSRSETGFKSSLSVFKTFVENFQMISSKVYITNDKKKGKAKPQSFLRKK